APALAAHAARPAGGRAAAGAGRRGLPLRDRVRRSHLPRRRGDRSLAGSSAAGSTGVARVTRNWKRAALTLLAVTIGVGALFQCTFAALCDDDPLGQSVSPRGTIATSFVRNCGATTGYATWVTLRPWCSPF